MKKMCKNFTALLMAAMMVLSIAVAATAAAPAADSFGLTVKDGQVQFTKNGVVTSKVDSKDSKITLTTSATTGSLLVCFVDKSGKTRNLSLGTQTSLTIEGTLAALTLDKNLADNIAVTLGKTASVTTMTVATPNPVAINGKVGTLNVTDAATVTIAGNAKITKKNVTAAKAKLTTLAAGVAATATPSKAPAATTKPATKPTTTTKPATKPTTTTGSSQLRLKATPIKLDDEVNLGDIVDELNDNVSASDATTGDSVSGTCKWTGGNGKTVSKDGTYSFTFVPDDSSYKNATGSVKIYVEGAYGDLTIYGKELMNAKEGDKISSLNSELNDLIYAEDDDGNEVAGKAKFTSTGKFERLGEREYQFTFTPKDSGRYNKVTDRIKILVEK